MDELFAALCRSSGRGWRGRNNCVRRQKELVMNWRRDWFSYKTKLIWPMKLWWETKTSPTLNIHTLIAWVLARAQIYLYLYSTLGVWGSYCSWWLLWFGTHLFSPKHCSVAGVFVCFSCCLFLLSLASQSHMIIFLRVYFCFISVLSHDILRLNVQFTFWGCFGSCKKKKLKLT